MRSLGFDVERTRNGVVLDVGTELAVLVTEAVQVYSVEADSPALARLANKLGDVTGTEVT